MLVDKNPKKRSIAYPRDLRNRVFAKNPVSGVRIFLLQRWDGGDRQEKQHKNNPISSCIK
ncbi:MAG: hypothetical protein SXA11_24025 [Cyanobacteriota bacterium]|nr:hypothetical protein [Cyanobacteriota bacterium]